MEDKNNVFQFITEHTYLRPLCKDIPKASEYLNLISKINQKLLQNETQKQYYALSCVIIAAIEAGNADKVVITDIFMLNKISLNSKDFLVALSTTYTVLMHTNCINKLAEIKIQCLISSMATLSLLFQEARSGSVRSFPEPSNASQASTYLVLTWSIFCYFYHSFSLTDAKVLRFLLILSQSIALSAMFPESQPWKQRYDSAVMKLDEESIKAGRDSVRLFRGVYEAQIQNLTSKILIEISEKKTAEKIFMKLKTESNYTNLVNAFDYLMFFENDETREICENFHQKKILDILNPINDKISQTRLGQLSTSATTLAAMKTDSETVNKFFFLILKSCFSETEKYPAAKLEGANLLDSCLLAAQSLAARFNNEEFVVNQKPAPLSLKHIVYIKNTLEKDSILPYWLTESLNCLIFGLCWDFSCFDKKNFWGLKTEDRNEILDIIDEYVFTPFFEYSVTLLPVSLAQNSRRLFRDLLQKSFNDKNILYSMQNSVPLEWAFSCFYLSINISIICDKKFEKLFGAFSAEKIIEKAGNLFDVSQLDSTNTISWIKTHSQSLKLSCHSFYSDAVKSLGAFEGSASPVTSREASPCYYRSSGETVVYETEYAKLRRQ